MIIISMKNLIYSVFKEGKDFLNKEYQPVKENWMIVNIVMFLTPTLILMGYTYLIAFFGKFGINYEFYFSIGDCINILYQKAVLFFYLWGIYWLLLIPIILYFTIYLNKEEKYTNKKVLLKIVSITLLFSLFFFVLSGIDSMPISNPYILMISVFFTLLFWLFYFKMITLITLVCSFVVFAYKYGEYDAEKIINNKTKNTLNIILKDRGVVLSDSDTCKYLIKRTSTHIFIGDRCGDLVNIYPVSEEIEMCFKTEK